MFQAFDAIVGVDMRGTNIRADVVQLSLKAVRKGKDMEVPALAGW
jgi:hypothetical protein